MLSGQVLFHRLVVTTYTHIDDLSISFIAVHYRRHNNQGISIDEIPYASLILVVGWLGNEVEFQGACEVQSGERQQCCPPKRMHIES